MRYAQQYSTMAEAVNLSFASLESADYLMYYYYMNILRICRYHENVKINIISLNNWPKMYERTVHSWE